MCLWATPQDGRARMGMRIPGPVQEAHPSLTLGREDSLWQPASSELCMMACSIYVVYSMLAASQDIRAQEGSDNAHPGNSAGHGRPGAQAGHTPTRGNSTSRQAGKPVTVDAATHTCACTRKRAARTFRPPSRRVTEACGGDALIIRTSSARKTIAIDPIPGMWSTAGGKRTDPTRGRLLTLSDFSGPEALQDAYSVGCVHVCGSRQTATSRQSGLSESCGVMWSHVC